jgi:hypothetical protein
MLSQGLFPFLMESAQIAQDLLEFSHFVGRKRPILIRRDSALRLSLRKNAS